MVDEYGALLEKCEQREAEILGEKPVCPPQIPMD
jgi:hypothetical protein